MKASVQYNDIIGTVTADVSDWYSSSLQAFLEKTYEAFDGNRHSCRGCTTYMGSADNGYISFIWLDKESPVCEISISVIMESIVCSSPFSDGLKS